MRALIAASLVAVAACGSARHVVIHPDEVPGRKGDTWHVTSEPSAAASREVHATP